LPSGVAWQNGGGLITDKPAVAVSYYWGTLGDVYVSWTVRDTRSGQGTNSQLWVSRSKDGGATFEQPVVVTWDDVNDASLAVDPNLGTVYVVWVNFRFGDIRVAQSSGNDAVLAFGAHSIISQGGIVHSLTGVRAPTVPITKYNGIANKLMVMWHGTPSGSNGADIFYSFYPCSTNCNAYLWQTVAVGQDKTGDQFEPSFDYYGYGGDVITMFYSRRDDQPNNNKYAEYVTTFHADGTSTGVNDVRVGWDCFGGATSCPSDPTYSNANTVDPNFIGDYQDAWIWGYSDGTRLVSSFTRVFQEQQKVGDIYVARTAP
jgi:hypothetical protein